MLGIKVRTFHHLKNILSQNSYFLICNNNRIRNGGNYGYACLVDNQVLFLQNMGGKDMYSLPSHISQQLGNVVSKYNYYIFLNDPTALLQFGDEIIAISEDDLSKYDQFLLQNNKQLTNSIDYEQYHILYFYLISNGSPNLVLWALKNFYKNKVPFVLLSNVIKIIVSYQQLINRLSKGTPTAYNSYSQVQELMTELVTLRRIKRANDMINMFNTAQKKLLKQCEQTNDFISMLNKFGLISQTKRRNFIRKMSTISDVNTILQEMSLLTKIHYSWNKESLIEFIEKGDGLNCSIIYNNDNIVIVSVNDYDSIKFLAKNTNWCISKNKEYWNHYMQVSNKQYIIFDFSKKEDDHFSILGLTTNNGEIVASHNFVNDNINNGSLNIPQINSFAITKYSIFHWLTVNHIPIGLFMQPLPLHFNWNKEECKTFLRNVAEKNYIILCDHDNKLAIRIKNTAWLKCLGKMKQGFQYYNEVIVFFNFDLPQSDSNSLIIALITSDEDKESCNSIINAYNQSVTSYTFDMLLDEYGMPFNVIQRDDNKLDVIMSLIRICNCEMLDKLLQVEEYKRLLFNNKIKRKLSDLVSKSIFRYNTEDVIRLLYKHNLTLSKLCGTRGIEYLLLELIASILEKEEFLQDVDYVDDKLFEKCTNGDLPFNKAVCIGHLHALNLIISNETNPNIISAQLFRHIQESTMNTHVRTLLLKCLLPLAVHSLNQLRLCLPLLIEIDNDTLWQYVRENTTIPKERIQEIINHNTFLQDHADKILSVINS